MEEIKKAMDNIRSSYGRFEEFHKSYRIHGKNEHKSCKIYIMAWKKRGMIINIFCFDFTQAPI